MKTYRKIIAILLAVGLVLPGAGLVTFAEEVENVHRLAGADRYKTAVAVSEETYTTADAVVLAGGMAEVDALTGTLLAAAKNAPLLYTDKAALTAATKVEIAKLAPTTVYVLGGKAAVEEAVVTELKTLGYTVKRVEGLNRQATAAAVAEEANFAKGHAFIVRDGVSSSLVDALAVAPASYKMKSPVFLTKHGALHPETKEALKGYTSVTVIGGETAVSKAVETELTEMGLTVNTRVAGLDRDKTAVAIANKYFAGATQAVLANGHGKTLVDALVGGYLGGMKDAPVLYTKVNQIPTVTADFVEELNSVYMLGGTTVMSAALETAVGKLLEVDELKVVSVSAINGKEVEVKFNKAVKKSTVVSGSDLLTNITFQNLTGAPAVTSTSAKASLSADGKTLTVVPTGTEHFNGDYAVTITKVVQDTNDEFFGGYAQVVSLKDDVRPQIASVTYPVNGVARVTFTEAINVADDTAVKAALTITNKAGNVISSTNYSVTLAANKKSFDINISNADFIAKDVNTATLIGLKDYAGNLISPNPVTFSIVKDTVDNVKPTVVNVESAGVGVAKITFSEKLSNYGSINGELIGIGTNATVDESGLVVTVTTAGTASPALNGVTLVTLTGFADLSTNTGEPFTKLVNFVADTTAPKYVSHEIATIGTDQYLLVKYDEDVNVNASATNALTGTYVDANQITKPMTSPIATTDASKHLVGGATTTNTIKIKITGLASGNYTATIDGALVEDLALAKNKAVAKTLTFSVGTFLDPSVPVATIGNVQVSEDLVVVTFDRDVTAASALNVSNYKVEGVNVFESAIFSGDAKTVHLKLKANAISMTGDRLFTISNVQTAAGKTMKTVNTVKEFKDNVKPVLKSAAFTGAKTIKATFSKTLSAGSANAFEVYKDGVKLTGVTAAIASAGSADVIITLPSDVVIGSTYQVKYIGNDFKDQITPANTAVTGTTVTVQ